MTFPIHNAASPFGSLSANDRIDPSPNSEKSFLSSFVDPDESGKLELSNFVCLELSLISAKFIPLVPHVTLDRDRLLCVESARSANGKEPNVRPSACCPADERMLAAKWTRRLVCLLFKRNHFRIRLVLGCSLGHCLIARLD